MKRARIFLFFLLLFSLSFSARCACAQSAWLSTNAVLEGGTVVVYWSGFGGNVNLKFYKGSTFMGYANTNAPGVGDQDFVMSGYAVGSDYRVRVELRSDTGVYRDTGFFSVNTPGAPVIRVEPERLDF